VIPIYIFVSREIGDQEEQGKQTRTAENPRIKRQNKRIKKEMERHIIFILPQWSADDAIPPAFCSIIPHVHLVDSEASFLGVSQSAEYQHKHKEVSIIRTIPNPLYPLLPLPLPSYFFFIITFQLFLFLQPNYYLLLTTHTST
jgi:hypothetical protein